MGSFNKARKGSSGWKKPTTGRFEGQKDIWQNVRVSNRFLSINKGIHNRGYEIVVFSINAPRNEKAFSKSTKAEALKFANNYMKRHPSG